MKKRVREEEEEYEDKYWEEPGYLGVLNHYVEQEQDSEISHNHSAYYISKREDITRFFVNFTVKELNNSFSFHVFYHWNEVVSFCKNLCAEGNLKPVRRQDSSAFRPIYTKIKEAIHSWTLCARRLGIPRDVRQMISEILYNRPWEWKK